MIGAFTVLWLNVANSSFSPEVWSTYSLFAPIWRKYSTKRNCLISEDFSAPPSPCSKVEFQESLLTAFSILQLFWFFCDFQGPCCNGSSEVWLWVFSLSSSRKWRQGQEFTLCCFLNTRKNHFSVSPSYTPHSHVWPHISNTCHQHNRNVYPYRSTLLPERDGSGLSIYWVECLEAGRFYSSLWLY